MIVTNVLDFRSLRRSWRLLIAFTSFLYFSVVLSETMRLYLYIPLQADICICEGGIASCSSACNTVRLYAVPFPAAMASGTFVLGCTFRSIFIRYCRAAARARRCNRSFLALLESRRLNLAVYTALGSVYDCFARQRCEYVLIKIGRELYVRSTGFCSVMGLLGSVIFPLHVTSEFKSRMLIKFYLRCDPALKVMVCN